MKKDVTEIVNQKILECLENGVAPWDKPWKCSGRSQANLVSKKPYRGINQFLLNFTDFTSPWWVTFNQAKNYGGSVRLGEHGTIVVFWKIFEKENKANPENPKKSAMLRYYKIFNVDQCDGISDRIPLPPIPEERDPIVEAEKIFAGYRNAPETKFGSDQACYCPATDVVKMPEIGFFDVSESFYSVLFHELVHSTGAKKRLDRDTLVNAHGFGSEVYSREELTAEIGACYLCAQAGVKNQIERSSSYIEHWGAFLKSDPFAFMSAASKADKAVDHILDILEEKDGESASEGEET